MRRPGHLAGEQIRLAINVTRTRRTNRPAATDRRVGCPRSGAGKLPILIDRQTSRDPTRPE
jgi:hypothetical protein